MQVCFINDSASDIDSSDDEVEDTTSKQPGDNKVASPIWHTCLEGIAFPSNVYNLFFP